LITDGDYYKLEIKIEEGKEKTTRNYHQKWQEGEPQHFKGVELMCKMIIDLGLTSQEDIPEDNLKEQYKILESKGCFVGFYTFEVDSMISGGQLGKEVFKTVYSEVRPGGEKQQKNFEDVLDADNFWATLTKIEDNISKGRFAQRFASHLTLDFVPEYMQNGIAEIIRKVNSTHE
jgi:putative ATP-dependent endonuclease of OLD family